MKKILMLILLLVIALPLMGREYESPMSIYKDNYFLSGDKIEDQVIFQISAKFDPFYPLDLGAYFAYTQKSHWKIYDNSAPFKENNYMPEVFFQFTSGKNIFNNAVIPGVDYIKASPIFHKSNGLEGAESRSINTYYGEMQVSAGEVLNIGASGKVFAYYNKSRKNEDINKYNKNYEANIFLKLRSKNVMYLDKEEINVRFAGNPTGNGWYEAEFKFRILTTYVQPKLFIQFRSGYDEFLINYNEKQKSLRAGLVF